MSGMEFTNLIKQISKGILDEDQPTEIVIGTLESVNPLQVRINASETPLKEPFIKYAGGTQPIAKEAVGQDVVLIKQRGGNAYYLLYGEYYPGARIETGVVTSVSPARVRLTSTGETVSNIRIPSKWRLEEEYINEQVVLISDGTQWVLLEKRVQSWADIADILKPSMESVARKEANDAISSESAAIHAWNKNLKRLEDMVDERLKALDKRISQATQDIVMGDCQIITGNPLVISFDGKQYSRQNAMIGLVAPNGYFSGAPDLSPGERYFCIVVTQGDLLAQVAVFADPGYGRRSGS